MFRRRVAVVCGLCLLPAVAAAAPAGAELRRNCEGAASGAFKPNFASARTSSIVTGVDGYIVYGTATLRDGLAADFVCQFDSAGAFRRIDTAQPVSPAADLSPAPGPSSAARKACEARADSYLRLPPGTAEAQDAQPISGGAYRLLMRAGHAKAYCTVDASGRVTGMDPP
jgi:hypothetical protein